MRVVVVGAGVLGASTAFHLALAGAEVVLVDRGHEGRATAAGAGIVSPWASEATDPEWHRIAQAGARYYPALAGLLAEHGEADTGYRVVGSLSVARERGALDRIERAVLARRAEAPEAGEVSRLSPAEARALFPPLHPDLAAVRIGGGARVDGRLLAAALRRAAERRGARVHAGASATGLQTGGGGRVAGVRLGVEAVGADAVVVAAGVWAPALLETVGIELLVSPQRGQISHLRLEGAATGSWPVVLPPGSHYLLAFDDSRVVVGATREAGAGFDCRVTAAGQAEVLNQALAVAPGLGSATLVETRVGLRPVGPDVRPMLGGVPGLGGLVIGDGLGPSGLTIGPYAGRLLARAALGEAPEMDLSPFDPLRRPRAGPPAGDLDKVR